MSTQISHIKNSRLITSIAVHKLYMALRDLTNLFEAQKQRFVDLVSKSESNQHIRVLTERFDGEGAVPDHFNGDEDMYLHHVMNQFTEGMIDDARIKSGSIPMLSLDRMAYLENVGDGDFWINKVRRQPEDASWSITFQYKGVIFEIERKQGLTRAIATLNRHYLGLST